MLWICLLLHFVHIHAVVYVDGIENPNNEERDSGWRRKTAVMGRPRPYRLHGCSRLPLRAGTGITTYM